MNEANKKQEKINKFNEFLSRYADMSSRIAHYYRDREPTAEEEQMIERLLQMAERVIDTADRNHR